MDLSKEWYRSEFMQHETMSLHIPIEKEYYDYIAIADGNLDYVTQNRDETSFINPEGKGILSENHLQNIKYHFVVAVALITRYCIANGLEQEKAYNLSDFYIFKMDKCQTPQEIAKLHNTMCYDFCQNMHKLKKSGILSKPVVLCMDYIYSHIHTRITIKQLAEHTNLSESYLSKIFRKEMGMPVSEYVIHLKIEKAKNLLAFSDYSLIDISNYLAFSSQSHFIQVFQKKVGMTPHKYRLKNFRHHWEKL